jgi:PTH1 family peptidyl-tRNA hydrolase
LVGLGNPGPQYELTPHNLGFLTIDRLAERNSIRVSRPESQALVGEGLIAGRRSVLAKPQTFMNVSGPSVRALMERYSVAPAGVVVIFDDLDLPWTAVRIRAKGSAASHNGMKSVVKSLGTEEFPRVRLGIHPGRPVNNGKDFVLSPFRKAQLQELDELLDHAAGAVESIIAEGVEKSMTKFNRRAQGLTREDR